MRPPTLRPNHAALIAARARHMRHEPTLPELLLWQQIRSRQLGVAFRRQVCIGPFVADFVAPSVRLVIEVDGRNHMRRRAADARRDRKLRRWGWRVLRIEAELVLQELPVAVARVRRAIQGEP